MKLFAPRNVIWCHFGSWSTADHLSTGTWTTEPPQPDPTTAGQLLSPRKLHLPISGMEEQLGTQKCRLLPPDQEMVHLETSSPKAPSAEVVVTVGAFHWGKQCPLMPLPTEHPKIHLLPTVQLL